MKSIFNTKASMMALATLTIFSSELSASFDRDKNLQQQVQDNEQLDRVEQAAVELFRKYNPDVLLDRDKPKNIKAVKDNFHAIKTLMVSQLGAPAIAEPTKGQMELFTRLVEKQRSYYRLSDNYNYDKRIYKQVGWMIQEGYGGKDGKESFYMAGVLEIDEDKKQVEFDFFENLQAKFNWRADRSGMLDDIIPQAKEWIIKKNIDRPSSGTYRFSTPLTQDIFPRSANVIFKNMSEPDSRGLIKLVDPKAIPN